MIKTKNKKLSNNKELAEKWKFYLWQLKNLHFQASSNYSSRHNWTGIPLVLLAAIANASIWSVVVDVNFMEEDVSKILLAIIATVITVLSAVQAFLGFDKKSEMHKNAAMKYSSLSADLELMLHSGNSITDEDMKAIKTNWNIVTDNAPVLPKIKQVKEYIKNKDK